MLCTLTASLALSGSPSSALNTWRVSRLTAWSRSLDRRFDREYFAFNKARTDLRYRTQILVVDGDGARARLCEALLDKLCENVDADVDAMAASLSDAPTIKDSKSTKYANVDAMGVAARCENLGLSRLPFQAAARSLKPTDLLAASRWDVVVVTDLASLERVRELARAVNALDSEGGSLENVDAEWARDDSSLRTWRSHPSGEGMDCAVLCLSDYLASVVPSVDESAHFTELRALFDPGGEERRGEDADAPPPPQLDAMRIDLPSLLPDEPRGEEDESAMELPSLATSSDDEGGSRAAAVDELISTAAVCCAGLLTYLQAVMREHALRIFRRDLQASFVRGTAASAAPWAEARAQLQMEHEVAGGLDEEELQELYEAYVASGPVRVDVSDLGLTIGDLEGPVGGLG